MGASLIRELSQLKKIRRSFELFCLKNRNKGIPNLMLYVCVGNAIVYLMSQVAGSTYLYSLLLFSRTAILRGQVWRLISWPLTMYRNNILLMAVALLCYYSLGRVIEQLWGTCKFNLFYLSGIVMMDVYCMIFGCQADVSYLNSSLFMSYATMFPSATFLLFFIIPVKAWIFALLNLIEIVIGLVTYPFPYNLFPIIALMNYFLFFGKDAVNVIPQSWRLWLRRHLGGKQTTAKHQQPKVVQFRTASREKPDYNHRCTVCGRTDVTNPELEFRYCSRCKGYYCYCQDHINNHTHIE